MTYLIKEKFNISELAYKKQQVVRVAVIEPEEYLLWLYCHILGKTGFEVKGYRHFLDLDESLEGAGGCVLLINPVLILHPEFKTAIERRHSGLDMKVLSIGHSTDMETIKAVMAKGAVSHIDRKLTRPKDIIQIIYALTK